MFDPALPRLLTVLAPATRAGRAIWHRDEEGFTFTGSEASVELRDIGLWPRIIILDSRGHELTEAAIPSGDDSFDAALRDLVNAVEMSVIARLDAQARILAKTEVARAMARDVVIRAMLAELDGLAVSA